MRWIVESTLWRACGLALATAWIGLAAPAGERELEEAEWEPSEEWVEELERMPSEPSRNQDTRESEVENRRDEDSRQDRERDRDHREDRDRDSRPELLRLPGPSAEERARDHLETYERPPVPWVDIGPQTDVDAQINAIDQLMNRPKKPPATAPPTRTQPRPVHTPPALDSTDIDPTLKLRPDGTGLYFGEEVEALECVASEAMVSARGRATSYSPSATGCTRLQEYRKKVDQREDAKKQGKDPDKLHPFTRSEISLRLTLAMMRGSAQLDGERQCAAKLTCTKRSCSGTCASQFKETVEAITCKVKKNKPRRPKKAKKKQDRGPFSRLRVTKLGTCECECQKESACAESPERFVF